MRAIVKGSRARLLSAETSSPEVYLVSNKPLEELLFNRNVLGNEFRRLTYESSRLMLRHVVDELSSAAYSELVVLSKGLVYQLAQAAAVEGIADLPCNLIATSRVAVTAKTAEVAVSYSRFDAGGERLIIGDTIASGSTMIAVLSSYLKKRPLREVIILSYAGTWIGVAAITQFCRDNGVACKHLLGLAAFGLGANGFDLSFLHPETICDAAYVARAAEQFAGKPVSAVGWDFGSQAMAPQKYRELVWLEAEVFGLHGHPSLACAVKPGDLENLRQEKAAFGDQ